MLRIDKRCCWFVRYGLRNACNLQAYMSWWAALGIEWAVAGMDSIEDYYNWGAGRKGK